MISQHTPLLNQDPNLSKGLYDPKPQENRSSFKEVRSVNPQESLSPPLSVSPRFQVVQSSERGMVGLLPTPILNEAKRRLNRLQQEGLIVRYVPEPECLGDDVYVFTVFARWESPEKYAQIVGQVGVELMIDSEPDYLLLAHIKPADDNKA